MKGLDLVVAFATLAGLSTTPAKTSVLGRWLTDDSSGVVEIAPCGTAICGTLVEVLDPKAPRRDINNPDPLLRTRSLKGLPILTGFTRAARDASGGHAYDPKTGRTYRARIRLAAEDRLDVTGCLLFICRTKQWSRVAPEQSR